MKPTDFCKHVENHLGWAPPAGPAWRQYQAEAHKVSARQASNPELFTWDNLQLAVNLLRKEKKSATPLGVFYHVDRALDLAMDKQHDTEVELQEIIRHEAERGDPDGWVGRLSRARGIYRQEALAEWKLNDKVPA